MGSCIVYMFDAACTGLRYNDDAFDSKMIMKPGAYTIKVAVSTDEDSANNAISYVARRQGHVHLDQGVQVCLEQYGDGAGIWKTVSKAEGEGYVRVTVASTNSDDARNYTFATRAETTVEAQIVDQDKLDFCDVLSGEAAWYFDAVDQVYDNRYMTGHDRAKLALRSLNPLLCLALTQCITPIAGTMSVTLGMEG